MNNFTIPYEVADGITLANLKEQYYHLVNELRQHEEENTYMHPDDVRYSRERIIPALKVLIHYYGGNINE